MEKVYKFYLLITNDERLKTAFVFSSRRISYLRINIIICVVKYLHGIVILELNVFNIIKHIITFKHMFLSASIKLRTVDLFP